MTRRKVKKEKKKGAYVSTTK